IACDPEISVHCRGHRERCVLLRLSKMCTRESPLFPGPHLGSEPSNPNQLELRLRPSDPGGWVCGRVRRKSYRGTTAPEIDASILHMSSDKCSAKAQHVSLRPIPRQPPVRLRPPRLQLMCAPPDFL